MSLRSWWTGLGDPANLGYVRAAQAAWDRGDHIHVVRVPSTWSTSGGHSTEALNRRLERIASIGWRLQAGSREVGHGTVMFSFVRPSYSSLS